MFYKVENENGICPQNWQLKKNRAKKVSINRVCQIHNRLNTKERADI